MSVLSAGQGRSLVPVQGGRRRPSSLRRQAVRVITGHRIEVPVTELIYTATNRRGSIIEANCTFARLSGYDRNSLLGLPHNLIRHPDMPAGVFRAIWRELAAGRAAAGYVQNLSADGTAYWTFATFTPGGGGHLSIRQRPCTALLPEVADLYSQVRRYELELRAQGAATAESAVRGEARLLEGLAGLGFDSYHAFVLEVLPAEVAARNALRDGAPDEGPHRPGLEELFATVAATERGVRDLVAALHDNRADDPALSRLIDEARSTAEVLGGALSGADALPDEDPAGPAPTHLALPSRCSRVGTTLVALLEAARAVQYARQEMRCGAALAHLQTEMMSRYLHRLDTGLESAHSCTHTVERLTDALYAQLQEIGGVLRLNTSMTRRLDDLARALRTTTQDVAVCQGQGADLDPDMAGRLTELTSALSTAGRHLAGMRAVAERFEEAVAGFDPQQTARQLVRWDEALRHELTCAAS